MKTLTAVIMVLILTVMGQPCFARGGHGSGHSRGGSSHGVRSGHSGHGSRGAGRSAHGVRLVHHKTKLSQPVSI